MKLNKILLLYIILYCNILHADNFEHKFNYFGNLTATKVNNDNYYIKNYHANKVTNEIRFSPYSKLGFQSTLYNDNTTFVAQAIINKRDNQSEDITAELNWLNGKYKFDASNSVKIGRMQTALFLNSDSLDINYLHNLAKDKNIVYTLVPMKFYDGVELKHQHNFNKYIFTTTIIPYGTTTTKVNEFVNNGVFKSKDIKIISFDIQGDNFKFKTSYLDSHFSINIDDPNYKALMNNLNNQGYDITRYSYDNKHLKQYNFGLEYSLEKFTITTEYSQSNNSNSLLPKTKAYYTMISYDVDDIKPYIMYSKNKNDKSHFNTNGINSTELEALLYSTNSSETTYTLGIRYEIKMGIALKLQLDKISTNDYGVDYNSIKDREGYTSRYANSEQKPIYQLTFGVSFAF